MTRSGWIGLSIVLCLVLSLAARAADEYKLVPGDAIRVTVVNHLDFGGTVTLLPDGTVTLPVVGACALGGLTLAETATLLTKGYAKRLNDPEVYVALAAAHAPRAENVYALGAVKAPGMYPLKGEMRVLELLMTANGLSQDVADCQAFLLRKGSKERLPVALAALLGGRTEGDLPLHDGDVLLIETRPRVSIFVGGEVANPGVYELTQGSTLAQALARAQGVTGDPLQKRLTILRGKDMLNVDLSALYRPNSTVDQPVQQGDILRVESALISVTVSGEVTTPGAYSVKRDLGMAELMKLAGGATAAGNQAAVVLSHEDGSQETVNLGQPAQTVRLRAGDRVHVPTTLVNVTVSGEVKSPGTYRLMPRTRLSEMLTLAGGATRTAALGTIRVIHLTGAIETRDVDVEVTLADGDRIIVPFATAQIAVLGNVRLPGYYTIDERTPGKVSEAIIRAGGLDDESRPKETTLTRVVNGTPTKMKIVFDKTLRATDPHADLLLQAGDTIFVPKASRSLWSGLMNGLTNALTLITVFGRL